MNNICRNYIKELSFLFMGQRPGFGPSWKKSSEKQSEDWESGTIVKGFLCNHEESHRSGSRETKEKLQEIVHGELT